MNTHFSQHCIVLYLRLPKRRAVVGNDNQLTCKQRKETELNLYIQEIINLKIKNELHIHHGEKQGHYQYILKHRVGFKMTKPLIIYKRTIKNK